MVDVRRLQAWIPQIISFTYVCQNASETIWGLAGLEWEDFELLPQHSETESQVIFPSFSYEAVEIVSNFSDL